MDHRVGADQHLLVVLAHKPVLGRNVPHGDHAGDFAVIHHGQVPEVGNGQLKAQCCACPCPAILPEGHGPDSRGSSQCRLGSR
ncbi:hypothetical protein C0214_06555 [Methylobacterium sp. DM1]|nr:hypothetical protein C0214_06555 [Methylobacterium sp. DM1]